MLPKLCAAIVAALALAGTSAAIAGEEKVDRERLKRAVATLPLVRMLWGIGIGPEGSMEWSEQSRTPPDPAELRARLKGDESDAYVHLELAAAYRRLGDTRQQSSNLRLAAALLRRRTTEHPDDSRALAALALALWTEGEDDDADDILRRAQALPRPGWQVWSATGGVLATRAIGELAGRKLRELRAAYGWLATSPSVRELPPTCASRLAEAAIAYDKAIDAARADGAPAADVAAVHLDRWAFRWHRLLLPKDTRAEAPAVADWAAAADDMAKAAEATPSDPRAITLVVALGLLPSPGDPLVAPKELPDLPAPARAAVEDGLARLTKLAESEDDAVAARALEGLGAIGTLRGDDPAKVEATMRRAVAKDPSLHQSWMLLVGMCVKAQRFDELVKVLGDWMKTGETAEKRVFLAKAHERRGDGAEAEKEWRLALALDPKGYESNLGLAAAILRNAKPGDDLKAVEGLVTTAGETYRPEADTASWRWVELALCEAVYLGLTGDKDGAEKSARRVLEFDARNSAAKDVLAAIGR